MVRPYVHVPVFLQLLIDVAPNLLASFCLPMLFYIAFCYYLKTESAELFSKACIYSFLYLVANEIFQLTRLFGRTFDYFDIAASFIGTVGVYMVVMKLITDRNNQKQTNLYDPQ